MQALKQVDPNMVIKKKNGKDTEVQEGWKGHILPFELVQRVLMKEEQRQIEEQRSRLEEISSEYEAVLEELSEEEKETISEALNDGNDAFVLKNVNPVIKILRREDASGNQALIRKLQKVEALGAEEKKLKSEIKNEEESLHLRTKERLENLGDEELRELLQEKWIRPISEGILALPQNEIHKLQKEIEALSKKYSDTYQDIVTEIDETSRSLCRMLSELTGSESDMAGVQEFCKLLGGGR